MRDVMPSVIRLPVHRRDTRHSCHRCPVLAPARAPSYHARQRHSLWLPAKQLFYVATLWRSLVVPVAAPCARCLPSCRLPPAQWRLTHRMLAGPSSVR